MAEINSINPRMLTIPMVAKYLSATNWFCEELIRNKQLPARKHGKSWVVDLHDINTWIGQRKEADDFKEMMANARTMTDEEAQAFFANARRDKDGRIIGTDPDLERDPWDGEHSEDCRCELCRKWNGEIADEGDK
jgi:excisionase family DNA binding protein